MNLLAIITLQNAGMHVLTMVIHTIAQDITLHGAVVNNN